jgi:hypothetical protein
MDFKDALAADIDNVFFETKEFADNAIIDGKSVPIILDNDALNGKSETYAVGLSEGEQLIFIKQKDLLRPPLPGEQMTIDGKQWYVRHSLSNKGVFELRIGRRRANG